MSGADSPGPQQAKDRDDLKAILNRASGGIVFTTIQKFAPAKGETTYPRLSDWRNIYAPRFPRMQRDNLEQTGILKSL